jgi:hypothetical protein
MAKVLNEILDSFYTRLSESDAVDESTIEAIRSLFASGKRLKADDFVGILSEAAKEPPP